MTTTASLLLEDGSVRSGVSVGSAGLRVGELVFNTAMCGYQEILSDPSYAGQIICFTTPHLGVVGVNDEDDEAGEVHASGMIVRDCQEHYSNWRAQRSLREYLRERGIVGVSEIDTRSLTRLLRNSGTMRAAIFTDDVSLEQARKALEGFAGLNGADLAQTVTADAASEWDQGVVYGAKTVKSESDRRFKVVAYDFGVKRNILRLLVEGGCEVTVVPAKTSVEKALARKPDGVFLSNGPGDPEPCDYAVGAIRELLDAQVPMFGICLGHQLLGLASGARTRKMKFGHHGANHPVADIESGRVYITSQNHNFCLDDDLPDTLTPTHRSLFDGSLQGVRHKTAPAFGFQGHPEASPGPHDIAPIFDSFSELMRAHAKAD